MAAKKILMHSMTSCEEEDMMGKMYGCEKILTNLMTSFEKEDTAGQMSDCEN